MTGYVRDMCLHPPQTSAKPTFEQTLWDIFEITKRTKMSVQKGHLDTLQIYRFRGVAKITVYVPKTDSCRLWEEVAPKGLLPTNPHQNLSRTEQVQNPQNRQNLVGKS